jgi:TonB C terminal
MLALLLAVATTATAQDSVPATPAPPAACKKLTGEHKTQVSMAFRYQPTAPLDPTYARAVFDSIAGQWARPRFKHERTALTFTLRRDAEVKTYRLVRSSGDKDFDRVAARALALAAVGHKIPPLPATYAGDSVVFELMFGDLADYMDSVGALSDQQLAQPWPTNEVPQWPARWKVTGGSAPVVAEFEIDSTGRVDASTIRITNAPNADFASSLRSVIPYWRFYPAVEHCHRVRSKYHFTETYGSY